MINAYQGLKFALGLTQSPCRLKMLFHCLCFVQFEIGQVTIKRQKIMNREPLEKITKIKLKILLILIQLYLLSCFSGMGERALPSPLSVSNFVA